MDFGHLDLNENVHSVSHYFLLTKFGKYNIAEAPTRQIAGKWDSGRILKLARCI